MTVPVQRLSASAAGSHDLLAQAVHAANARDPSAAELAKVGELVFASVGRGTVSGAGWYAKPWLPAIVGVVAIAGWGAYGWRPGVAPQVLPHASHAAPAPGEQTLAPAPANTAVPATVTPEPNVALLRSPTVLANNGRPVGRHAGLAPPGTELELLRAAEAVLRDAPLAALARTDDHLRAYPAGLLAQERELLAIDALVRLGRRAPAEERARRFENRYPDSPLRRRLPRVLGNSATVTTHTGEERTTP